MARLLLTVWPHPTHLHPFLALANAARARGHVVMFYTGGAGLSVTRREGFHAFPFCEVDWASIVHILEDLVAARKRPSRMAQLWTQFLVGTVPAQVRDLERVLDECPADAVICDITMWAPMLLLHELRSIPVVPLSHLAYSLLPGPDGPIQGVALPRRRKGLISTYARVAATAAARVMAQTRTEANALRRRFGLPPTGTSINEFTGTMPLYLLPTAPEFDNFRRDLPPSARYVGACTWDPSADEPEDAGLRGLDVDRPCVIVDEGALFPKEPLLLKAAAEGLANLPLSVILIAGYGRDAGNLDLGDLPRNVRLRPFTPIRNVLPICDALVTNGNSESVMAALVTGIPVVVLPSLLDQAEIAWRVQETGVGLRVAPGWATPRRLRRAAERVLGERTFRDKAHEMAARLACYGGADRGVDFIEELVSERSTTPGMVL